MAGGKRHRHHGGSGASSGRGAHGGSSPAAGKSKHHEETTSPSSSNSNSNNNNNNNNNNNIHDADDDNNESSYDFCQTFFGDPLFTNLNVSLLFLIATFLPLIVWIPHFVSEHVHNRHLQYMEEERLSRMQLVKAEMENRRRRRREAIMRDISERHSVLDEELFHQESVVEGKEDSYYNIPRPQQQHPVQRQEQQPYVNQQKQHHQQLESDNNIKILQDSTSTLRSSKSTDVHNFMYLEVDDGETDEEQYLHKFVDGENYANSHSKRKKKIHSSAESSGSNSQGNGAGGEDAPTTTHNKYRQDNDNNWNANTFLMGSAQLSIPPTLCPDGVTIGYDDWFVLRDAISMTNSIAAMNFLQWNEYLASNYHSDSGSTHRDGGQYYEPPTYIPPDPFVICPGVTLTRKSKYGWRRLISPYHWISYLASVLLITSTSTSTTDKAQQPAMHHPLRHYPPNRSNRNKLSSIFINAEDITIECDMCVIDLPGTHFSFGSHAKNVHIKGITFRGATTSSLIFHHHGSEVGFEDCNWLYNSGYQIRNVAGGQGAGDGGSPTATMNNNGIHNTPGVVGGGSTMTGAVADINSTSIVTFYRCVLDETKQSPVRTTTGAGVANVPGIPPAGLMMMNHGGAVASSLTIRN